jgi:hypothetical protein
MSQHSGVSVEKIAYKGWPNCYRVGNGTVELIVTGDVGPRVMRYGFTGGANLFKEFEEQMGGRGEKELRLRGGNRLWLAPEDPVASWMPDNEAVAITPSAKGLIARGPIEKQTGLQKELEITMDSSGSGVTVAHRLWNRSLFPQEYSAWVLTMMAPGGLAVAGLPPRGAHPRDLAPTNPLTLWAYTDLSDARFRITRRHLALRQKAGDVPPQKIGSFSPDTWIGYFLGGQLFVKRAKASREQRYPDYGCSLELFTNGEFTEIETLGPLARVAPGAAAVQVERWSLFDKVREPEATDAALDAVFKPILGRKETAL